MTTPRILNRAAAIVRRHPDLAWIALLVVIASAIRLAFAFRVPVFIRPDSVGYYQTAYELVHGLGGEIPMRRTAGYPLFLALVIALFGEDFQGIALVQHGLGVATAILVYFTAKRLFGRPAGIVASLLIGLSGPLIVYEHYLMSEPLFTFFIALAFWLLVRGTQTVRAPMFLVAGCAVGAAYLARPVGGALLPVFMLGAAFAAGTPWQRGLRAMILTAGFVLVLGPSVVASRLSGGEAAPALGQTLYGRIVRHDESIKYPDPDSPAPYTEPERVAARRMILQAADRDLRPSAINHRLQNSLGLTAVEADRALREVVLETIRNQPERYVTGSIKKTRLILLGEVEKLGFHWNSRVDKDLREIWQSNASIAHTLTPPTDSHRREQPTTEAILRVFQPAQHRPLLAGLMALAILGGVVRAQWRLALLIPVAVMVLVIPAALLVGQVPRYRYPADPLLAVLVGGGVSVALYGATRLRQMMRERSRGQSGQAFGSVHEAGSAGG